jgi:hypothetical protein
MRAFSNKSQNPPKQREVALSARSSQRMLLEERSYFLDQLPSIAYFKPITEAVVWSAISLDVYPSASKELAKFVKHDPIFRPKFQAEARLHFRSTALRLIEVDGETSFAIDQTNHIISGQHQVFPFRRLGRPTMGSADFLLRR